MNYHHEFHAGNFADVFKHIVLSRALLHLCAKQTPFRYIETHAGSGLYDLSSLDAGKTAEWRGGIGKLTAAEAEPHVQRVIEPYLHIVAPLLEKSPKQYGGSPWIAKTLLRRQDRMLLCELHPRAFAALRANVGYDARIKLFQVDSYARLKAFLPPVERRGLVLIDPPFEAAEEFTKATDAIETAWRKWATGMLMLWYPIKNTRTCTSFATNLAERGVKRILRLELQIGPPIPQGSLARCGLLIVNPPFRLDADAKILLPWLATVLGSGKPGFLIEWLGGE